MGNGRSRNEWWRILAYGVWCAIATYWQLAPHSQPTPQPQASALVTRVVSGQTIEVTLNNRTETIRLTGIDAPDLRQSPWGVASQQALAQQIEGRMIGLEWQQLDPAGLPERDRFDRLHAAVWIDGQLVQAELLRSGWGLVQEAQDAQNTQNTQTQLYGSELQNAETEARSLDRGLWSPAAALRQHPTQFRSER